MTQPCILCGDQHENKGRLCTPCETHNGNRPAANTEPIPLGDPVPSGYVLAKLDGEPVWVPGEWVDRDGKVSRPRKGSKLGCGES